MSAPVCTYCGVRIVWGETFDGKRIPLDPRAPVYQYAAGRAALIPLEGPEHLRTVMVSHFATCPEVTRKGKRA